MSEHRRFLRKSRLTARESAGSPGFPLVTNWLRLLHLSARSREGARLRLGLRQEVDVVLQHSVDELGGEVRAGSLAGRRLVVLQSPFATRLLRRRCVLLSRNSGIEVLNNFLLNLIIVKLSMERNNIKLP